MNIRTNSLLLLTGFFISCTQLTSKSELEKQANSYVEIVSRRKNITEFAALYNDPVNYSDPIWGMDNKLVTKDTLILWFAPVFDDSTGLDFEINNIAVDEKTNTFSLKGYTFDRATQEKRIFTSWFKLEKGKIVEQIDFTPWSLVSLAYSPRFENALKHLIVETDSVSATTE